MSSDFDQMQGYLLAISAVVSGLAPEFNEKFKNLSVLQDVCNFVLEHLSDSGQFSLKGFGYLIKASCSFMQTVLATDLALSVEQVIWKVLEKKMLDLADSIYCNL
jgi:hypothetical protein